ncbi:MAG: ABC transporter ATP-binding protein, partial [bacterium]
MTGERLLQVQDLTVRYQTQMGETHAVSGVTFFVNKNEVFGIAGESGCGKSTLIRALMRLLPDNAKMSAQSIEYEGEELTRLSEAKFREKILWARMSLVPQSAMNSLNPVYRVGDQVVEAIQAHKNVSKSEARERVTELFDIVGLQPDLMQNFPHEFSGGMRQRAMIAMSLALDPGLVVLVQERILRRIREIRSQISSSIILITHDIAVIAEMSDRIAVMYGGQIMEQAPANDLFDSPCHPYTLGLKNAFPSIRNLHQKLISIPGSPPTLLGAPSSCPFQERCPFSVEQCNQKNPENITIQPLHEVRCVRHGEAPLLREKAS